MSEEENEELELDEIPEGAQQRLFKIAISKDKMYVRMYPLVGTKREGGLATYEEIVHACKLDKIKAEIDKELIKKQLLEVAPEEVVIASGKKPENGKDGHIEYKFDMSAKPQFIADASDTKAIDYKNSMQVTLVKIDDILAVVIPPTEGEPGEDVIGNPIAAKPGVPARYFLGDGLEEKDGNIIVTAPGTPSVQDDILMIRRSYVLQSDVDLSTGNINFPGTVIIHGGIADGFEVVSEENVVINGVISGAKIKAKGYIKCAGGIQGKGKAEIISGSFVAATFINAANIVAEGDVLVTKDIMHSNISCLGELRAGGSLVGGITTAFAGVECGGGVGSETGTKTVVNIRTHYRQEKAKELANSVLEEANTLFEKYKTWNKMDSLTAEEEKSFLQDIASLNELIKKRIVFDNRVAKFDLMVYENKTAKLKVLGMLEADVIIASPYTRYVSVVEMKGPLVVSENNEYQKMAIMKDFERR